MWDCEPVLYWRTRQDGKWSWQKAKAARTEMGLWALEMPRLKVIETVTESKPETKPCHGGSDCTVDKCGCYDE